MVLSTSYSFSRQREGMMYDIINQLSCNEIRLSSRIPSNLQEHAKKFFAMVSSALVLGSEGGEPTAVRGVAMDIRNFLCACDLANIWFCSQEKTEREKYFGILWKMFVAELMEQIDEKGGEKLSRFSQEVAEALENKEMLVLLTTRRLPGHLQMAG